jgi:CHAT domain-containing protein
VFVPHGPLHAVPFAALPVDGGEPLVESRVVSIVPSASCRRFVARPPRRPPRERSVLCVSTGSDDLPGAREEIDMVRRTFRRGRTLFGRRATWQAFRESVSSADIVHLATHGLFRADDPVFSALLLSDGWVRLADLLTLELDADLVCLSACQSGLVGVGGGDEMVGLCRGFLHAGARSLLVSLWAVEDRATAGLMRSVYGALRRGVDPALALALAMREARRTHDHPFHWAPFVAVSWPAAGGAGSTARPGGVARRRRPG